MRSRNKVRVLIRTTSMEEATQHKNHRAPTLEGRGGSKPGHLHVAAPVGSNRPTGVSSVSL